MWSALRKISATSPLGGNAALQNLARKSDGRLFDDIGLNREAFVNGTEEQMRQRYWWMM